MQFFLQVSVKAETESQQTTKICYEEFQELSSKYFTQKEEENVVLICSVNTLVNGNGFES